MPFRSLACRLAVAAAVLGGTVGACGGDDRPRTATPAGNGTDAAFAARMIALQQSAVLMARVAADRARSANVRDIAADIVREQTGQIAILRRERDALADVEPARLAGAAGDGAMHDDAHALERSRRVDTRFLKLMVPRHERAIELARAELAAGRDPDLRRLAEAIVAVRQREIAAMREHLERAAAGGGETHGGGSDAHGGGYPE